MCAYAPVHVRVCVCVSLRRNVGYLVNISDIDWIFIQGWKFWELKCAVSQVNYQKRAFKMNKMNRWRNWQDSYLYLHVYGLLNLGGSLSINRKILCSSNICNYKSIPSNTHTHTHIHTHTHTHNIYIYIYIYYAWRIGKCKKSENCRILNGNYNHWMTLY